MLVSILMPTRNPFDMLRTALKSIRETSWNSPDVEILLKVDDDDKERIALLPELEADFSVHSVIGPRGTPYLDMGPYVESLVAKAEGRWGWLFDDDAYIEGDWLRQVACAPCSAEEGPALAAEFYCLGGSNYINYPDSASPPGLMMPMSLLKKSKLINPVDQQFTDMIRQRNWKYTILRDVTYHHDGRPR